MKRPDKITILIAILKQCKDSSIAKNDPNWFDQEFLVKSFSAARFVYDTWDSSLNLIDNINKIAG